MSCYFPMVTVLRILCILLFILHMAGGCDVEERIALMRIRSSLVAANSQVPASWGQSDDCCSWERVRCNNDTRVSELNLYSMYFPQPKSTIEDQASVDSGRECCCWNQSLTIFSSFHELQLLDLSFNGACFQDFDGLQSLTKLRYLNLSGNSLIGNNILECIGKLASLEVINICETSISGALPNTTAFRNLKNLRELLLGSNQLNGSIPVFLFELSSLEHLDLSSNHLQGLPMSSSLSISSSLEVLNLSDNNLNGTFDFFWLRNCAKLKEVDLSRNAHITIDVKLYRSVPPFQLGELMLSGCNLDNSVIAGPNFLSTQHHLQILDLSNNKLTGSIPTWILANQLTLVYLNLANNSLVVSLNLIWQQQSNNLQMIDISMNRFVGQLPTNISSVFPNLEILDTSYNSISGDLPPSLCKIRNLTVLNLSKNKLTGVVPTCLFTGTLDLLKLSNNNLGGPILGGVSNLPNVAEIYLASNNFEGTLPNNLSGNLEVMDLRDNKLSGKLDMSFWNLSSLRVLSVASNNLTDEIHPGICKLTGLQFLDMSDNKFSGSGPNCESNSTLLQFLKMSSNNLSGFPGAFIRNSGVVALDLRYNQFKGNLDWIQHLPDIKVLLLGGNIFDGQIPLHLCHFQYVNIIDLSHNKLSGALPPCVGGISFIYHDNDENFWSSIYQSQGFQISFSNANYDYPPSTTLDAYDLQGFTFSTKGNIYTYGRTFFSIMFGIDLSANLLSGEIPWEIGNLSHVKSLNLSHNFFTGQIPATFGNMSAIESLDLSDNKLSGSIPWQLTQLRWLEVFSVAYNNLSGCIPSSGQLGSFSAESYVGNVNLHNISQGNRCSSMSVPVEKEAVEEASDDPVLYIISASSFILAFWATVVFMFFHSFGQQVVLHL